MNPIGLAPRAAAACNRVHPMRLRPVVLPLLVSLLSARVFATTVRIGADRPGARVNPAMWGIFFEDINFGADGGLYAELVKNRYFDFLTADCSVLFGECLKAGEVLQEPIPAGRLGHAHAV